MKRLFVVFAIGLLAGCGSSGRTTAASATCTGSTVTGSLRIVGGPAPGVNHAVPGTIQALGPGGPCGVRTNTDGTFRMQLRGGRYDFIGRPEDGTGPCRASGVVVPAREPVAVTCDIP